MLSPLDHFESSNVVPFGSFSRAKIKITHLLTEHSACWGKFFILVVKLCIVYLVWKWRIRPFLLIVNLIYLILKSSSVCHSVILSSFHSSQIFLNSVCHASACETLVNLNSLHNSSYRSSYSYCQAQPKAQLSWAEFSIILNFAKHSLLNREA